MRILARVMFSGGDLVFAVMGVNRRRFCFVTKTLSESPTMITTGLN